ncbi:hypothetical protein PPL_05212 [Heterostelium album PN500]|uniref:Uncharacterized protein n=1 Tax=Heterostelium pallidum (strain ATCC 26659 / Pp 5 / PN500) TaxID=670386 RepID=D3B9R6_HETP5|nr:hypothetical protein PPL_05212 [Heterostelium album PN500]EFA81978.1 hypothetical protein PPL_05212 [Heterostelium album PN500]|eukprot:XP_020434095.1 hypothetical protein PPL_05212 [Heterostelium album PN500]
MNKEESFKHFPAQFHDSRYEHTFDLQQRSKNETWFLTLLKVDLVCMKIKKQPNYSNTPYTPRKYNQKSQPCSR